MIKAIVPRKLKNYLNFIFDRRPSFYCPFCGHKNKELFEIGADFPVLTEKKIVGGGKRMAGCLSCKSNDRERLIYTYLKEEISIDKKAGKLKILHFAPEKHISDKLRQLNLQSYVCGDLFTDGYQYPEYVQNMNVLKIPFDNNVFDIVLCNHVLEHIPEDIEAMKEIYRVLNFGGIAILQVPISQNLRQTFEDFNVKDPKERELVFGQFDHVRIYGQDYVKRLSSVGFRVERLNISKKYPNYGLNIDEDLFICKKTELHTGK